MKKKSIIFSYLIVFISILMLASAIKHRSSGFQKGKVSSLSWKCVVTYSTKKDGHKYYRHSSVCEKGTDVYRLEPQPWADETVEEIAVYYYVTIDNGDGNNVYSVAESIWENISQGDKIEYISIPDGSRGSTNTITKATFFHKKFGEKITYSATPPERSKVDDNKNSDC